MALPLCAVAEYPINYTTDTIINTSARHLDYVSLTSPAFGAQKLSASQVDNGSRLYLDLTDKCFIAAAGEKVTPAVTWSSNWMHSYLFVDYGNDGEFSNTLDATTNGALTDGSSDVVSFSYYNGYNSLGTAISNQNPGVTLPAFTIPADLTAGTLYRMRYKIDWNSIDPGGNYEGTVGINQQSIVENNGAIADVLLYIVPSTPEVNTSASNGTISLGSTAATGQDLVVTLTPNDGYRFNSLTVNSTLSTGNSAVSFVDESLGDKTTVLRSNKFNADGTITIPGSYLLGSVTLTAEFIEDNSGSGDNYACAISGTKTADSGLTALQIGGTSLSINSLTAYTELLDSWVNVEAASTLNVVPTYSGAATTLNLFVDYDNDARFTAVDGSAASELVAAIPSTGSGNFTLPADIESGVYRARIEAADGTCAVDFLLLVASGEGNLDAKALNGFIISATPYSTDGTPCPLPNTIAAGTALSVKALPTLTGFSTTELIVRHGANLNGEQFINGNKQWTDETFTIGTDGVVNIPASSISGDVDLYAIFTEDADSEWTKVWSDEFSGDSVDLTRWGYHVGRYDSAWNRYVAITDEARQTVNKIEDGHYKAYCIATPEKFNGTEDDREMISGALNSTGKFSTTFGKVEARVRSNRHTGNFPAFWMLPDDGSLGWPAAGEIDIWETINDEYSCYTTIHSGWTYKTYGNVEQSTPTSSSRAWADVERWQIYAVEWDAEQIRWYLNGRQIFTYDNQHYTDANNASYTEEITWPFSKAFYIIVNQSVGNGAWASDPDMDYTYLTEFDYVRVYKKKGDDGYTATATNSDEQDANFYVPGVDSPIESSIINIEPAAIDADAANAPTEYFNLRGQRVSASALVPGIYLQRRGNSTTKITVK
jgi:beta-glucanase (GH16 family)